jgi:hypothetical protein
MQMWQLILPMIFIFSMTCLTMGFIALLKQKLYIDSTTNEPTEVSLPIVGKMKTNYPALIFVIIGFVSMYPVYTMYQAASEEKEDYLIKGRLEVASPVTTGESHGNAANPDFSTSTIVPFPSDVSNPHMERSGVFSLTIKVPRGKTFEEQVQSLQFNGPPDFIGSINTEHALNDPRTLISSTRNSREYKFLVEPAFPQGN